MRWEGSNASTSYANVFELSADRSEVTLSFGSKGRRVPGTDELVLEVSDRIVLSPSTAKRLAAMLAHAVRDYEWEHGSLGGEPLPPAAPLSSRKSPVSLTEGIPEQAAELLRLVEDLGVQPVLERSFKMFERTLLANRFLWGFKRDSLSEDAGGRLLAICERLRMPERFVAAFRENIFQANIVFFGFEESERTQRYKAYLEFGGRLVRAKAENRRDPLLMYLGFKWDADDSRRCSVARYTCHPGLSTDDMLERMARAFAGGPSGTPLALAREIVLQAAGRVAADRFLYLETTEEGNPRNSFDINLYNARLRLRDLHALFLRICEHYAISADRFEAAYAQVSAAPFGHVTGGFDREGKDFLSIYFGAQ
ncbi:MAG: hypothetical protein A3I14_00060 [Candidatus Rokubacteria bacterium RIFCSPLOWO2_02_FULL_73_56]|nr:MAG: hypothetical protein A3D33_10725 [Candidatus Rokubacteria bacterium RIFCSPHIGHO2_02_FULL_73_26]OGL13265.1 MAG: hypothetical protein A3I14_00060 [Candidatus Rokubacteria bacterium RIFCSPLOWO2_02_FULL_73_56]